VWTAAADGQPVVPCEGELPDPCIAYLPNGSVHWTWDAHHKGVGACDQTLAGDWPAGSVNDSRNGAGGAGIQPSSQVFVLQPDGAGHYGYWGLGSWSGPKPMTCTDGDTTRYPPGYMDLSEGDSGSGVADGAGNTCAHTTWQIDVKATTIAGSCSAWSNSGSSMTYEWSLKRTGGAPGR
jgi:hypothetical protein